VTTGTGRLGGGRRPRNDHQRGDRTASDERIRAEDDPQSHEARAAREEPVRRQSQGRGAGRLRARVQRGPASQPRGGWLRLESPEALADLVTHVDEIAAIPSSIRRGIEVRLKKAQRRFTPSPTVRATRALVAATVDDPVS